MRLAACRFIAIISLAIAPFSLSFADPPTSENHTLRWDTVDAGGARIP